MCNITTGIGLTRGNAASDDVLAIILSEIPLFKQDRRVQEFPPGLSGTYINGAPHSFCCIYGFAFVLEASIST